MKWTRVDECSFALHLKDFFFQRNSTQRDTRAWITQQHLQFWSIY